MGIFTELVKRLEQLLINIASDREVRLDAKTLLTEEELEEEPYQRKFVSGLLYCSGNKKVAYAYTFENNNTDREQELLTTIENELGDSCSNLRDNHGYSQDESDPNGSDPIYPDIEVGLE